MTNQALSEKLTEYLPNLEIAIEEVFDNVRVLSQAWDFRMEKYTVPDDPKPFYKLIITPKGVDGQTAYEYYKSIKDDLEDLE